MVLLLIVILFHAACLFCVTHMKGGEMDAGSRLLAWMMPIFGPLAVMVISTAAQKTADKSRRDGETKYSLDAVTSSLNVRPLAASSVVPLEDALILDTPVQRRSLILNVLNDEPADYLDVLKEAQQNDDGEVVHYATTALAEQFSMADRSLQAAEKAYQENPENLDALKTLIKVLREYISLGSAQGTAARIRKEEYAKLLEQLLRTEFCLENAAELCRICLELRSHSSTVWALELMEANWPRSEELFTLSLEYAWNENNQAMARELLDRARKGDFLLTKAARERFSIWLNKEENS